MHTFGGPVEQAELAYSLTQIPFVYYQTVFFVVNSNLAWSTFQYGHNWAGAVHLACDGTTSGSCNSEAFVLFWCQFSLIVVYLSLLVSAAHLAECYGDKVYHYDLGNDLDNLWTESQNLLKSMGSRKKAQ